MHYMYFKSTIIFLAVLVCVNCSYIQKHQLETQYSQVEQEISLSTLNNVNEYTSQTPFQKTYEFEFDSSNNNPYALIFYMSESSFSKSIIKHRNIGDLHRSAVRIDESVNILTALNKNLPNADHVSWQQISNQITKEEARDGYHVMQEFIRLKIRDL